MAGLLDGIDPQTALLLGLGSGLLGTSGQGRRASFGEALANGMQQGTQGYRQAISDRQRAEQIAQQQAAQEQQMMLAREQMKLAQAQGVRQGEMHGLQMKEHALTVQDRARRQEMEAARGQYLQDVASGAKPINAAEAFRYGLSTADAKALAESGNWGKSKVASWKQIRDNNGKVVEQPFDEFGNPMGQGVTPFIKPEMIDLGGQRVAVDPTAVTPGQTFNKTMTPGEVASNAVARGNLGVAQANLGLSRQRLDLERQQAGGLTYIPDVGWAPKTIRPGEQPTVVPLPGGQAGKPPTEGQGKALLFGSRMKGADAKITQLEKSGTMSGSRIQQGAEAVPWVGGALGMAANSLASQSQQEYTQAKRDFVTAVLRRESGATIQPSEFSTADLMYFPQPGDGPKVIEQKQQLRKRATDALLYEAGPHAAQADRLAQPQPSATQHSASGAIRPAQPGTVLRFDAQGNMIGN